MLRPMHFHTVDRHGESQGIAKLRLPFHEFWCRIVRRSHNRVADCLAGGRGAGDLERIFADHRLTHAALSLDEWFSGSAHQPVALTSATAAGLRELAGTAEDLARDDGAWCEAAKELDLLADAAVHDLSEGIQRIVDELRRDRGPAAALEVLGQIRERLQDAGRVHEYPPRFSADHTQQLLRYGEQLRRMASPRGIRGLLLKVRPGTSWRLFTEEAERMYVRHEVIPALDRAAGLRFHHERTKRLQRVYEGLLGSEQQAGLLEALRAAVEQEVAQFAQLKVPEESRPVRPAGPHEMLVVESLDTVIHPHSRRRVGDLYDEKLAQAGFSASRLAEDLRSGGLVIEGRRLRPHEWQTCAVSAVRQALQQQVRQHLGAASSDPRINLRDPQTPLDFAASVTPLDDELRPLVQRLIPAFVRQAAPFCDTEDIVGAAAIDYPLLYCYAPDRAEWEDVLRGQVTIANPRTDLDDGGAYAPRHPYTVILASYRLAMPLGAYRKLADWASCGNQLCRSGQHQPLLDRSALAEVRLLPVRPEDYTDSQDLFRAAVTASIIRDLPHTGGPGLRYAMRVRRADLEDLFVEVAFEPTLVTEETLHEALDDPQFREFVVHRVPGAADFHQRALVLARERDAAIVAAALAEMQVVTREAARHVRLNVPVQQEARQLPRRFFDRTVGALRGLDEEQFVGTLHRHDDLYNAVFWRVLDALERGELSPHDVPAFVLERSRNRNRRGRSTHAARHSA